MADRTFSIEIQGVKESVKNLQSLEEVLSKMEKEVETIKKAGGFQVITKEANKATKEAIDLAKAEEIANGEVISSYKEKQKALSTLGKEIKSMKVTDEEVEQQQKALIGQYNELNGQLKAFDAHLGNHQRNVGDYRGALKEATMELKSMKGEMLGLDKGSEQFKKLAQEAGELQDKIGDINAEIKRNASDTRGLDNVINLAQSAASAFELYKGAMNAFGIETKGAEEAMQQLMGAMSIVQSLQSLSDTLQSGSATAQAFQKVMKLLGLEFLTTSQGATGLATAEGAATVATNTLSTASKALRIALASIGIGLVIIAVTELVTHWEDLCNWFDKTFPIVNRLGGVLNTLKSICMGLGKAILNWVVNPVKTMANVISKVLKGDFEGAMNAVTEGIKNQFKGTADAFKEGFQKQVEQGLEEITLKNLKETNKQTKQELEELKIRERNNKTYSKKYIALQQKDFDERKKLAKGNKDELNKIKLEELQFYASVEDKKTAAAQAGASARVKASNDAAKEAAKAEADRLREEQEKQKKLLEADKNMLAAYYKTFQIELKEQLRQAEMEVEKYTSGPIRKLVEALNNVQSLRGKIAKGDKDKSLEDLFMGADDNIKAVIGDIKTMQTIIDEIKKNKTLYIGDVEKINEIIDKLGKLSEEQEKVKAEVEKGMDETTKQTFEKNLKTFQESARAIGLEYTNTLRQASEANDKALTEGYKNAANALIKNGEFVYKQFLESIQNDPKAKPIRNRVFGFIDKDETLRNLAYMKAQWEEVLQTINNEIKTSEDKWQEYINGVAALYGEDSQKYKDAVQEKIEALKKLKKMQEEVGMRANAPVSLEGDYNGDGKPDAAEKKRQLWYGKGETDSQGREYTLFDNMANLFDALDEMVLAPAMDTFSMYMDFAIEETQAKLDIIQDLHDEATDKLEASAEKISELNDLMRDSSNGNLEQTKQQLADEQLLYAQRLAAEQKLAQQEKDLQNKANEQEYQSRMMELKYQLFLSMANTAMGVSKTLAEWPWPLSGVFAGIVGTLGAIQTGIIAKHIASFPKPRKLAEGGLISGPTHAMGGVPVGNTGIEVEGGEAIINKKSSKKFRTLLDAINADGNGGKHTIANADKKVRRYADGGRLDFEAADSSLRQTGVNRILNAIESIDMHPVVAVKDIWKVEDRLTKVRSLAGR